MTEQSQSTRAAVAASLCAASAAAIALGIDARLVSRVDFGVVDTLAIVGFVALIAVPVLFVLALLGRRVARGWQGARDLAPTTVSAWIFVGSLAIAAYAFVLFRGTWLLASWTQFKPKVIVLAQPLIAVGGALVIALVAGPAARALATLLERRAPRIRARTVAIVVGVLAIAALAIVWRVVLVARLFPRELQRDSLLGPTGRLVAPLIALALLVAIPVWWRRMGVRLVGALAVTMALASIVVAIVTVRSRANNALLIWAEQPLASAVIEHISSPTAIRADLPATLAPVARPGAEHRDIVVIMVDGLRGDRIPPLRPNAAPIQLPALRALAERAAYASSMYASSSSSLFATAALVIGTGADRIRGTRAGSADLSSLDPRHVFLAERMRAGGYATAAFVCCPELYRPTAALALSRGFEHVERGDGETDLAKRAAAYLAMAPTGRPRFAWLHLRAPVTWMSHEIAQERPYDAYEITLADVDRAIAAFVAGLAEIPPDRAPVIVIVGTHGEAFGERSSRGHGSDLSEQQLHVAFLVSGPGIVRTEIRGPTSTVDVVPTVLDLAGFVAPRGVRIDGQSLAPQARTASSPAMSRVVTASLPFDTKRMVIIDGRWKLLETGTFSELYDLRSDTAERNNRTKDYPDIAAALRARLNARHANARLEPF